MQGKVTSWTMLFPSLPLARGREFDCLCMRTGYSSASLGGISENTQSLFLSQLGYLSIHLSINDVIHTYHMVMNYFSIYSSSWVAMKRYLEPCMTSFSDFFVTLRWCHSSFNITLGKVRSEKYLGKCFSSNHILVDCDLDLFSGNAPTSKIHTTFDEKCTFVVVCHTHTYTHTISEKPLSPG